MIRRCSNCKHFKSINGDSSLGYCKEKPLLFAFTHDPTVFAIVKNFYLCEGHQFANEELLASQSEPIDLKEHIKTLDHKNYSF
jgi:hypothetical protein